MDQKKILLVEDNFYLRELYSRVISQAGYNLTVAIDGEEGLSQAENIPDLILLDVMLPKLNGFEVLSQLKSNEKFKDIPVMLLTNLGMESVVIKAKDMGATDYLVKMYLDPYRLVDRITNYFNNPDEPVDWESKVL